MINNHFGKLLKFDSSQSRPQSLILATEINTLCTLVVAFSESSLWGFFFYIAESDSSLPFVKWFFRGKRGDTFKGTRKLKLVTSVILTR